MTDAERTKTRRRVIAHALQQVAMGACSISPEWIASALLNRRDLLDQIAAELPGRATILSERWEGVEGDLFSLRLAYVDGDSDAVAVVGTDSDDVAEGLDADLVWVSRADVQALWVASIPPARYVARGPDGETRDVTPPERP